MIDFSQSLQVLWIKKIGKVGKNTKYKDRKEGNVEPQRGTCENNNNTGNN